MAVLGNMDAGKSTLIGVLTQGVLDNGQGKTRLATFRHVHEVRSGRTSSISCQLLGFDGGGGDHDEEDQEEDSARVARCEQPFNWYWQRDRLHQRSHEEVVLASSKLVALIDLAGHHKYQRTTLFALTSRRPHLVLLVLPATHGLKGTAVDHCQFALTLGLPMAVVVTKTDRCPPDEAVTQLGCWLSRRGVAARLVTVTSLPDARRAARSIGSDPPSVIPVFPASCVSGAGVATLTAFLGTLRSGEGGSPQRHAEVWIDQVHYEVPRVAGCVLGGLVYAGAVAERQCLHLGPQQDGSFVAVAVQSIQRNRVQQAAVESGQYASFAVSLTGTDDSDEDSIDRLKVIPQSPQDDTGTGNNGTVANGPPASDNCVRRGMVLLASPPAMTDSEYAWRTPSTDAASPGAVVWGVVVTAVRMLDERHGTGGSSTSVTSLHRQQGGWIVHCGNVYQKSVMLRPACLPPHCPVASQVRLSVAIDNRYH